MKLSSFIPGLSKAYESVRNVFDSPNSAYLVLQNQGVHHQCWYDIEILIPNPVWDSVTRDIKRIEGMSQTKWTELAGYYCYNVVVPASNLTTTDIRIGGGDVFKVPYTREYSPLNLSFYIDGGYQDDGGRILKGLQGWVDFIYNPITRQLAYYSDYTTTIKVTLYTMPDGNPAFGKGGKEIIGHIVFHEAYPANIEQLTLSGNSTNEPTQFSVQFNYRYSTTSESQRNTSTFGKLSDMVKGGFRMFRGIKNKIRSVKTAIRDVGNIFK